MGQPKHRFGLRIKVIQQCRRWNQELRPFEIVRSHCGIACTGRVVDEIRAQSVSIEEYILQDWPFAEGKNANAVELSSTIHRNAKPGTWLDLGCGPMLSVWPMFAIGVREIWGCDRHPGVSEFHKRFRPCAWQPSCGLSWMTQSATPQAEPHEGEKLG
jgi:hypothetical protein